MNDSVDTWEIALEIFKTADEAERQEDRLYISGDEILAEVERSGLEWFGAHCLFRNIVIRLKSELVKVERQLSQGTTIASRANTRELLDNLEYSIEHTEGAALRYFKQMFEVKVQGMTPPDIVAQCSMYIVQYRDYDFIVEACKEIRKPYSDLIAVLKQVRQDKLDLGLPADSIEFIESSQLRVIEPERSPTKDRRLTAFQTTLLLYCIYRELDPKGQRYESDRNGFKSLVQAVSGYSENTIHKIVTTTGVNSSERDGLITKYINETEKWVVDRGRVEAHLRTMGALRCVRWIDELTEGKLFGEVRLKDEEQNLVGF